MMAFRVIGFAGILLMLSSPVRAHWVSIGPEGGRIFSGVVTPGSPPSMLVASMNTGFPLLRSVDRGTSWELWGANLANYPRQLAAHPTDPDIIYGVAASSFYRTTDGGRTWTTHSLGPNNIGNDLAVNPLNPDVIYVPTYRWDGAAWRVTSTKSTDGGESWTQNPVDTIASSNVQSIAIDPVDTATVYIGGFVDGRTAFYRSTDGGGTWTRFEFPANYSSIYSIYVSPTDHNIVFAGALSGICRSTDRGETWERRSTSIYNYRIVTAPDDPGIMYSAAYNNVHRSTDAGMTWTAATGLRGNNLRTVLVVPDEPGAVFAGSDAGMFKSTDYGATWQETNNGINIGKIPVVTVSPHDPATVYAEIVNNNYFKSTDAGNTWVSQPRPSGCGEVCNITIDPHDPDRLYMLEGTG